MNRRQFLSTIGRGTILAGLTAISGVLVFRNTKNAEPCTYDFICRDCRELKSCKQPEAIIFKRGREKRNSVK